MKVTRATVTIGLAEWLALLEACETSFDEYVQKKAAEAKLAAETVEFTTTVHLPPETMR